MAQIQLIRHGEADFSFPRRWNTLGWGADLAPLTKRGEEQAACLAPRLHAWTPDVVLTSPTTRALSTALIAVHNTALPAKVEFDLHEWVPDMAFRWNDFSQVKASMDELRECGGEWPEGEERCWEPLSRVSKRTLAVLERYRTVPRVAAICHEVVIWSLTGEEETANCGIREIEV
jgi:broad specificity phosphatase PhoE